MPVDNLIEQLRTESVNQQYKGIKAFRTKWPERRALFASYLGDNPTQSKIIELGSHLSEAFRITGGANRSQSSVSGAGSTWEALVVWYLNLCLAGTQAVCIRGKRLCPKPLIDSLTVRHGRSLLRTEADVVVVSCRVLADAPPQRSISKAIAESSRLVQESFRSVGMFNLQCKTNWNDNAQIPMLWNMLYAQARNGTAIADGFLVGDGTFSLENLGHFGYGFVTVPTSEKGDPSKFTTQKAPVVRVSSMTAGNYWGHPTRSGIALSLQDFFNEFRREPQVFPNVSEVGAFASRALQAGSPDAEKLSAFRLSAD